MQTELGFYCFFCFFFHSPIFFGGLLFFLMRELGIEDKDKWGGGRNTRDT